MNSASNIGPKQSSPIESGSEQQQDQVMVIGSGKRVLKNAKSNEDFIGVPPDMTNTTNRGA